MTKPENKTMFSIPVPFEFKASDLSDLLVTVVECNHMTAAWAVFDGEVGMDYDLGSFESLDAAQAAAEAMGIDKGPAYCWLPLLPGCAVTIHEFDEADYDEENDRCRRVESYRLDLDAVKRGIVAMSVSAQRHFNDFTNGDYDIVTADVFLQMALLGEIRYG